MIAADRRAVSHRFASVCCSRRRESKRQNGRRARTGHFAAEMCCLVWLHFVLMVAILLGVHDICRFQKLVDCRTHSHVSMLVSQTVTRLPDPFYACRDV